MNKKSINKIKKELDKFINNYEDNISYGGYNIGAEARKRAKDAHEKQNEELKESIANILKETA